MFLLFSVMEILWTVFSTSRSLGGSIRPKTLWEAQWSPPKMHFRVQPQQMREAVKHPAAGKAELVDLSSWEQLDKGFAHPTALALKSPELVGKKDLATAALSLCPSTFWWVFMAVGETQACRVVCWSQSRARAEPTCTRYGLTHCGTALPQGEEPSTNYMGQRWGKSLPVQTKHRIKASDEHPKNPRLPSPGSHGCGFTVCKHRHFPRLLKWTGHATMFLKQKSNKSWGIPLTHTCFNYLFFFFFSFKGPGLSEWEYYPMGIENTMETGNF